MLAELLERWGLVPDGPPFTGGSAGSVVPVVRADDGLEAVLKIVDPPHREAREEATGLRLWDGRGAVRLYAEDRSAWALLVERCRPGTPISAFSNERLEAAAEVLVELWSLPVPDPSPFETVAGVCAEWAELMRRRMVELQPPFDPALIETGASLLESLPASATRSVVIHGDFNPGNVLSAERRPWLAIDAKPMVGDPGYDPMPMLLQLPPAPTTDAALVARYASFGAMVGQPADRLFAWSIARMTESALWHASRGELSSGAENMELAARLYRNC